MIFNPEIECMERGALRKLQLERLKLTVERCYNNVPLYRQRMDEMGVKPSDIKHLEDITKLPFTSKQDLRDSYPFGMFAVPKDEVVRIHASSGTTGKPTTVGYTKKDVHTWAECSARSIGCAGGTRNDVIQVSYGYGLFTGGLGLHYGGEMFGATVLPSSSGNTKRQIMLMEDFGTSILCCTPSYALVILEMIKEMEVSLDMLKLRAGMFGAEPWTEAMRAQIEEGLGIDALDIYGLSETMGPGVAMECIEEKRGLHFWEDNFIVEVVNPETGEQLPDGETGELVITTITKEAFPTIRYRTHDLSSIISEPCSCGRTHRRISRLKGRSDDMLIIRGVNVFPSQIETALLNIKGIQPHYLIVVDRVNNLDTLEVQVEIAPDAFSDTVRNIEKLRDSVANELQSALLVNVNVKLVAPKEIERSEGKAKRVIDKRKLYS